MLYRTLPNVRFGKRFALTELRKRRCGKFSKGEGKCGEFECAECIRRGWWCNLNICGVRLEYRNPFAFRAILTFPNLNLFVAWVHALRKSSSFELSNLEKKCNFNDVWLSGWQKILTIWTISVISYQNQISANNLNRCGFFQASTVQCWRNCSVFCMIKLKNQCFGHFFSEISKLKAWEITCWFHCRLLIFTDTSHRNIVDFQIPWIAQTRSMYCTRAQHTAYSMHTMFNILNQCTSLAYNEWI